MNRLAQKKNVLVTTLALLASFSGTAFAQTTPVPTAPNSDKPVFGSSAAYDFQDLLKSRLDEIFAFMSIEAFNNDSDDSGYQAAYQTFLAKIKASSLKFQNSDGINAIVNFLAWTDDAKKRNLTANQQAYQQAYALKKAELEQYRTNFRQSAADLIVLDGFLGFPISTFVFPELKTIEIDVAGRELYERVPFHGQVSPKKWRDAALTADAISIFGACQTSKCITDIAQAYQNWFQAVHKIVASVNTTAQGVDPFQGPSIIKASEIQKSLDFMTKVITQTEKIAK